MPPTSERLDSLARHDDDEACAHLAASERTIGARWLSLSPDREHARRLGELTIDRALASEGRLAVARALASIAAAVHRNFPNNLFCDLELIAGQLERGAARHGCGWVETTAGTIVELHDVFGCASSIQFRYVHDFLYGFDWARWVRSEPATRAEIGPFDEPFLLHARRRGAQLLELIAENDAKYHRLPPGADRNPFPFAREPAAERALLEDLARRGWIPVPAWREDGAPEWGRDYVAERQSTARRLGLAR